MLFSSRIILVKYCLKTPEVCLLGEIAEGTKKYYYLNNRYHMRFPWAEFDLAEEIDGMINIEEEKKTTVRQKMSKESGYTGLSLLHRLNILYKFDVSKDLVVDVMHNLPMNVVKKLLCRIKDSGVMLEEVDERLKLIKWTKG